MSFLGPSEVDVFTALRAFLLAVLPAGAEVVQAQNNGVPMPAGGFVAMNNIGIKRLSTNVDTYTPGTSNPGAKSLQTSVQYTVQLDFLGPTADQWAMTAQTMFRDEAGVALFPANVVPLYADDPIQIPLINAEQQYEQRWKLTAELQINPVYSNSQDFAGALKPTLVEIDAVYPP